MISYDEALALLKEYNEGEFHLKHAYIVSDVMGWFAEQLGYGEEKEFWSIVGLLHDLDFEQYPDQHCIKSQEIMRARGVDEAIIHATASHGYGIPWTFNLNIRWRRSSLPPTSSPASSGRRPSCGRPRVCPIWRSNR